MYVLYASALLFFGFSYISFKASKKAIGNTFLAMAMFLNPFGYDLVVYGLTLLTHDYWTTMLIMYLLAGSFFGMFLYLYKINPIIAVNNKLKTNLNKNGQNIR
jgi:hypothetical protein